MMRTKYPGLNTPYRRCNTAEWDQTGMEVVARALEFRL
jgi:hypothetical protein